MNPILTVALGVVAFGLCFILLRRELRRKKEKKNESNSLQKS